MSDDAVQYGAGRIKLGFTVGTLAFQAEGDVDAVLAAQSKYLDWLRDRVEVIAQIAALARPAMGPTQ